MSKHTLMGAAGLALAISASAFANEPKTYGPGTGGAIPDNNSAPFTRTIFVQDSGPIKDMQLNMNINHTWVGDLVVNLRHVESNTSAVVFNRPGFSGTGFGFSSDLAGNYSFADFFAGSFETAAATNPVAQGNYRPEGNFGVFDGLNKFGTWEISISDNAAADLGTLNSWSLVIFNIPAPSAAGFLGLAGLAAARRRR